MVPAARKSRESQRGLIGMRSGARSQLSCAPPSCLDAPCDTGFVGIGSDSLGGDEEAAALDRKAKPSAHGLDLGNPHGSKFGKAKAEIAKTEGDVRVLGIEFCEEPSAIGIRGEQFDHG